MGTIQHDAVLAIFWEDRAAAEGSAAFTDWRATLPEEWQRLAVGPIKPIINGGAIYAWLPDGSKEWWDTSNQGDEYRHQFVAAMRAVGQYPHIVEVSFGELGDRLTDVSDPDASSSPGSVPVDGPNRKDAAK